MGKKIARGFLVLLILALMPQVLLAQQNKPLPQKAKSVKELLDALSLLSTKHSPEELISGSRKIGELAEKDVKDEFEKEIKQAISILENLIKHPDKEVRIATLKGLAGTTDLGLIETLTPIANSGPLFPGKFFYETNLTEAGYAKRAIHSIQKKRDFNDSIAGLDDVWKARRLIEEIKTRKSKVSSEFLEAWMMAIGKQAVVPVIEALEEMNEIESRRVRRPKAYSLGYPGALPYIALNVLSKFGDLRAIDALEQMKPCSYFGAVTENVNQTIKTIREREADGE